MDLIKQFSLQQNNSFHIQAISPAVYKLNSKSDLFELPDLDSFYILGDGSNTLFVEDNAPIIIKPEFKGIKISETDDNFIVTICSGENWHDLVCFCVNRGIFGLENLALIPGSVGAAPVQNIGAYGVEFSDFCTSVSWFDFSNKKIKSIRSKDCHFAYRNSIFKQDLHNKGVIVEVVLSFSKKWQANLSYAGLNELGSNSTAKQVMEKVISLRNAKLPNPQKLPNAGSFFKNPIVSKQKLEQLTCIYPSMPFYSQPDGSAKLAAGWLIEQTGLKGYSVNNVGVHDKQALVLVNYDSNEGKYIVELAQFIQQQVLGKFGILLSPEVRMVTSKGEIDFSNLLNVNRMLENV